MQRNQKGIADKCRQLADEIRRRDPARARECRQLDGGIRRRTQRWRGERECRQLDNVMRRREDEMPSTRRRNTKKSEWDVGN